MTGFADLHRVHGTVLLEHRSDRPYDEQDPATILHPNGTHMRASDRGLCAALTVHALALTPGTSWSKAVA